MEAASLAASRAFYIGEECGEALVPWADMFNHKTDGEHVHVLGADDDDEDDEEEDESEEEESEEEESEEDESEEENEENEENEEEDAGPIEPPTGSLVIHACACAEKATSSSTPSANRTTPRCFTNTASASTTTRTPTCVSTSRSSRTWWGERRFATRRLSSAWTSRMAVL